jgi:site-specific DNA-cytosine methylase
MGLLVSGSSGRTLQGILDYCTAHEAVKIVILENVEPLLRKINGTSPYMILAGAFESLGFAVCHALLNACDYSLPQSRKRAVLSCRDLEAFMCQVWVCGLLFLDICRNAI